MNHTEMVSQHEFDLSLISVCGRGARKRQLSYFNHGQGVSSTKLWIHTVIKSLENQDGDSDGTKFTLGPCIWKNHDGGVKLCLSLLLRSTVDSKFVCRQDLNHFYQNC